MAYPLAVAVPVDTVATVFTADIHVGSGGSSSISNEKTSADMMVSSSLPAHTGGCNEAAITEYLTRAHFPTGLIEQAIISCRKFALRFFIIDNSGSMMTNDAHKLTTLGRGEANHENCTRWEELASTCRFQFGLVLASGGHAVFKFLNGPTVELPRDGLSGVALIEIALSDGPRGGTPLCARIGEVIAQIRAVEGTLRQNNKQACVIIMTDGESSDGDLTNAMRPLEQMPVWVVVRLSTDEEHVVGYWNEIDSELEIEMDVLDDIVSEAKEVYGKNPFLVYGEALHRLREFGFHRKEIDLLDEKELTLEQMDQLIRLLSGSQGSASLPRPTRDNIKSVYAPAVHRIFSSSSIPKVHNNLNKRASKWVDTAALSRTYGKAACTIA